LSHFPQKLSDSPKTGHNELSVTDMYRRPQSLKSSEKSCSIDAMMMLFADKTLLECIYLQLRLLANYQLLVYITSVGGLGYDYVFGDVQ